MKKNKKIALPSQISLLVEAIKCDNPDAARLLVERAMASAYTRKSWKMDELNAQEYDAVIALIRGINPRDTVEAILAAQFVALHLQSTNSIAGENYHIMGQNLQMMRLSHQALNMLQQYRGKSQTINVNYNMLNQGDTIVNTLVQQGAEQKKEQKS